MTLYNHFLSYVWLQKYIPMIEFPLPISLNFSPFIPDRGNLILALLGFNPKQG